jgi:chorismate mutase/prephenate dehydratase
MSEGAGIMDIENARCKIDQIDAQIVSLINERAALVQAIGATKATQELDVFAPARERQIMDLIAGRNQGPLEASALQAIYREIISACRALEHPLRIAYWGPPASNTHVASRARFGSAVEYLPADSIAGVFAEVESGGAEYGVVPVENSTEGIVNHTLDMFLDSELKICSETYTRISHHLLSNCDSVAEVRRVYTMPQATGQCRNWLERHLPAVERVEVTTTARAAEIAAQEAGAAAIANLAAAEQYGLGILAENIEDNPRNRTRFLVLGHTQPPVSGRDKTSIMFSVRHEAGELIRALSAFEKYDVNLTLIESRPTKRTPWEYVFFIDTCGHVADPTNPALRKALARFQQQCLFVKVLGSYPEAE